MENRKFKIGDKCKIVNYGHLIWQSKKSQEPIDKKFPIIFEYESFVYFDIRPDLVGKEVIIIGISSSGNRYSTDLFSWASEKQLELIK
jgi:hypothetical protein